MSCEEKRWKKSHKMLLLILKLESFFLDLLNLTIIFIFCREKMAQAYDFALDKMGMDIMSYQIWMDYINFLKSV